ncbi:MAG TPA: tetratricopeptide repeat protein [Thermoanaerobaculia bacterium]
MKLGFYAVCAASLTFLPAILAAEPVPAGSDPSAASYQFALGKLLAVEGSVNDALAAFDRAEKLAPEARETAYVLLEHAQLLDRMSQYARSTTLREDSLQKAAEKVAAARRLAPENLDVLRAVGEIYIDLAASDPNALTTAREALETVRRRDPRDAQSFLTLGRIYLDQNQPAKAAEVLRELVNNVPEQRMAYALLVESLMRANQPQEAEKALGEILASDPGALEARLSLADLQNRRGDAQAALQTLRGSGEDSRDDPRLKRQLAWALYQNGDLDEALKTIDSLSGQLKPQPQVQAQAPDAEGQQALTILRGLIYTAQGRNEEAIGLLTRVHAAEPKDTGIALTLARVMERTGRRDDAARLLNDLAAALEKDGKLKEAQEARLQAGQVYVDGKQWDKAAAALRPLLAAQDDAVRLQAEAQTADALAKAKRYDEALGVLAREKDSPAVIAKRAEVLSRAGRDAESGGLLAGLAAGDEASALAAAQTWQRLEKFPESIPILEKVAAAHPDQPVPGFLLGSAYERSGQRDKAIVEFQRILKIEPDFHAALNYLGYTYADEGVNLDEALKLVSRAVALDPDNGAYVDSLGWTYYRLGRTEQARGALERAARLEPEDATLQEHLGDVYVALGQTERARQAYQRSLELGSDDTAKVRRKLGDLDKTSGKNPGKTKSLRR